MTINLNRTDRIIFDYLSEGRITPNYVSSNEGLTTGNITNRLGRLVEHGYVEKLDRGLYELIEDPRKEDD